MIGKKNKKKTIRRDDDESIFLSIVTIGLIFFLGVVIYFSSQYTFWEKLALQTRQFKNNDAYSLLNTDNPELLEQSFWQLELLGEVAVPELLDIVTDEDKEDRERLNAIYALGRLGKNGAKSVNILMDFLRHENDNIRGVTVRALGKIGVGTVVFSVEPLLNDKNKWVREGAQWALSVIKSKDAREILKQHKLNAENVPAANDTLLWLEK